MTAPKTPGDAPARSSRPRIRVDRQDAEAQIGSQKEKGLGLLSMLETMAGADGEQASWDMMKVMERKYRQWDEYNSEMLLSLFDSEAVAREYGNWGTGIVRSYDTRLDQQFRRVRDALHDKMAALHSTKKKLHLYDIASQAPAPDEIVTWGNDVFVVHGHDEAAKQMVARFLDKLDFHAVILHELPDRGRTIIEKFEDYSDVGYAIVLLSADDIGASRDEPDDLQPRPRQNVVFELGFFVGKLGRDRVCVLYKEGVEILSDYQGVIYQPMDEGGAWRLEVAKEMREAELHVDLNKL
jgi:predicted nucleotide-binding protein